MADEPAVSEIKLTPDDRILVLAPHPDDEVIATGGVIQQAVKLGLPVRVVFFTYGDSNEWAFAVREKHPVVIPSAVEGMGLLRHDEALRADAVLGLATNQLTFLGYPDFGTMQIWSQHWGNSAPFRGMLTRATAVPYLNAFRPGASYIGDNILADLENIFRDFKPTKIFVSHPGDHHPDHRALYLFTRVALWDLEPTLTPDLFPYLVHFRNWPLPRGYHPESLLEPPALFAHTVEWRKNPVTPAIVEVKENALHMHDSQYRVSAAYLDSFMRSVEWFGDFPVETLAPLGTGAVVRANNNGMPEYLLDEERAAFIGIETRSAWIEDGHVVFQIGLSRPLAEAIEFRAWTFGYRKDKPFPEMPKIHIEIGVTGHKIYERGERLPNDTFQVIRNAKTIIIRIPLSALGDPDRILMAAQTSLGDIRMDWLSWRILKVPSAAKPK